MKAEKEFAAITGEIDQCLEQKAKQNVILQKIEHQRTKLTNPF